MKTGEKRKRKNSKGEFVSEHFGYWLHNIGTTHAGKQPKELL